MPGQHEIPPHAILRATDEWLGARLDDQAVVLMSGRTGRYVELNTSGSRIWEHVQAPIGLRELSERLSEEFETTAEQASADMQALLAQMIAEGVIAIDQA